METLNLDGLRQPILVNNRNVRKENPSVAQHFKVLEEEMNELPKVDGVVVDKKYVLWRGCPICDNAKTTHLFMKWGFLYDKCMNCQHVFVKNALREDVILELYRDSESDKHDRNAQKNSLYQLYWNKIYAKYIEVLKQYGLESGNLMDIGAGSGAFLDFCQKETDFTLYGSEFADDARENLESIVGKENFYHNVKLEDADFGSKKFQVLTAWGVLEHIYNPIPFLKKCGEILSPEGLFIAFVPNFNSRAIQILGISTPTLNPRGHIQNFTDQSITYACRLSGLKVVDKFGELPVIDLMYDHLSYSDELVKDICNLGQCYNNVYLIGRDK